MSESNDDYPERLIDAADHLNDLADESSDLNLESDVEVSLRLHAQQIRALAAAFSSISAEDAGLRIPEENDD